jgi:hypothetical protein
MKVKIRSKKRNFKNKQTAVEQDPFPEQAKKRERPYGGDDMRGPLDAEARDSNRDPRFAHQLDSDRADLKVWLFLFIGLATVAWGCKPRTASQKVEDKAEDVGHELGQSAERAGENVKDAGAEAGRETREGAENVKKKVNDATH